MFSNIRLNIAYDGTNYNGWQKNKLGGVEGTLELILQKILQQKIKLQAASRTDAGVHADGQVVDFLSSTSLNCSELQYKLNRLLPKDIVVLNAFEERLNFHPTLDVVSKEYHYRICYDTIQMPRSRYDSWHYAYPLDIDLMRTAAQNLIGIHDFAAFCNHRQNFIYASTKREIKSIEISRSSNCESLIAICGPNFLFRMVRNIVGTLAQIGSGKIPITKLTHILETGDRTLAGITAPAHGLNLYKIEY